MYAPPPLAYYLRPMCPPSPLSVLSLFHRLSGPVSSAFPVPSAHLAICPVSSGLLPCFIDFWVRFDVILTLFHRLFGPVLTTFLPGFSEEMGHFAPTSVLFTTPLCESSIASFRTSSETPHDPSRPDVMFHRGLCGSFAPFVNSCQKWSFRVSRMMPI